MSADSATGHRSARAHTTGAGAGAAVRPARRVSGPARPARPRAVPPTPARPLEAPAGQLLDVLRGLPEARWVDRLLRGRAWIALIGVALMGIVAMQVHLLKLNAGIGAGVERAAALERRNADLRSEVARLSTRGRVQQAAGQLGFVMPAAGDVRYVSPRPDDAVRAVRGMRPPRTPEELAAAAAQVALQQGQAAVPVDPATGAPLPAPAAPATPAAVPPDPTAATGAPAAPAPVTTEPVTP